MDEAEDFLKLMLNSLHFLANGTRPQLLLKAVTELRMLCLAGYMPDLTACEGCGKFEDTTMYFDKENGRLFCADCGAPIHRVISAPQVISGQAHRTSENHAGKHGFTQYKRAGKGVYEKTVGKGPAYISGD